MLRQAENRAESGSLHRTCAEAHNRVIWAALFRYWERFESKGLLLVRALFEDNEKYFTRIL